MCRVGHYNSSCVKTSTSFLFICESIFFSKSIDARSNFFKPCKKKESVKHSSNAQQMHTHTHARERAHERALIDIHICKKLKLVTEVEGDQKAPFSLATTLT